MQKLPVSLHQFTFTDTNFSTLTTFWLCSVLARLEYHKSIFWNEISMGGGGQWWSFVSSLWLMIFFMGALSIEKPWLLICNKYVSGAIFAVSSANPSPFLSPVYLLFLSFWIPCHLEKKEKCQSNIFYRMQQFGKQLLYFLVASQIVMPKMAYIFVLKHQDWTYNLPHAMLNDLCCHEPCLPHH